MEQSKPSIMEAKNDDGDESKAFQREFDKLRMGGLPSVNCCTG